MVPPERPQSTRRGPDGLRVALRLLLATALGAVATAGCDPDPARPERSANGAPAVPRLSRPVPLPRWSLPSRRASSPILVARSDELDDATGVLRRVLERHALDPRNPWAIAHGILALGPDARLPGGAPAVDRLFDFAELVEVGGEALPRFPIRASGERTIPVEPHPELVLKVLSERGLGPDRIVTVRGGARPLGDLYRFALARTWREGNRLGVGHPDAIAWGLQALVAWVEPPFPWLADEDRPMDLEAYARAAVEQLHAELRSPRAALGAGRAPEGASGLDTYTCGGFHLVQGVGHALARGFGSDAERESFREAIDVVFALYPVRMGQLGAALAQLPESRATLLSQRLKYTGHFVETVHKLAATDLFVPTQEQEISMVRAVGDLAATVFAIEQNGIFGRLEEIRSGDSQLYLDFVGDAAHAFRGLELATGTATVAY